MSVKESEMNTVKERNIRLLEIQKELKILDELDGSSSMQFEEISDPKFDPDEKPESIVQVINNTQIYSKKL